MNKVKIPPHLEHVAALPYEMKMVNYTALQQSSTAGLRRDSEFQTVGPAEEKA